MTQKKPFSGFPKGSTAPPSDAFAITPDDANDLATSIRSLYIGTGGNVAVMLESGNSVVYKNKASGSYITGFIKRVLFTGTSASDLIGEV